MRKNETEEQNLSAKPLCKSFSVGNSTSFVRSLMHWTLLQNPAFTKYQSKFSSIKLCENRVRSLQRKTRSMERVVRHLSCNRRHRRSRLVACLTFRRIAYSLILLYSVWLNQTAKHLQWSGCYFHLFANIKEKVGAAYALIYMQETQEKIV